MTDVTQRAEHANRIMTDDLVVEAFDTIERELKNYFAETAEPDKDGRERIYRMLWSTRKFREFFQLVMEQGQIHNWQLQQLKNGQL